MQVQLLPKKTLNKIDQMGKSFLWNDRDGKPKLRLLKWTAVTKTLRDGGLNIPNPTLRNKALVVHQAWHCFVTQLDAIWSKILKTNYKVNNIQFTIRNNASKIARSIKARWTVC